MAYPPPGVAAKLDRAREHLKTMERETDEFVQGEEEKPYGVDVQINSTVGEWKAIWRSGHPPLPLRFAVIFGEFFYLLRSAMDHLAWELVLVSGGAPTKETGFPITENADKFRSRGPQRMKGMSDPIQAVVEWAQPYNTWPEHPLHSTPWCIHDYCNIDKHRLLHLSELWLIRGWAKFRTADFPSGEGSIPIRVLKPPERMPLHDGAVLAHYSWNPGRTLGKKSQMEVNFNFSFDVALAEGEFLTDAGEPFKGMGTVQLMGTLMDYMDIGFLPAFEQFFS